MRMIVGPGLAAVRPPASARISHGAQGAQGANVVGKGALRAERHTRMAPLGPGQDVTLPAPCSVRSGNIVAILDRTSDGCRHLPDTPCGSCYPPIDCGAPFCGRAPEGGTVRDGAALAAYPRRAAGANAVPGDALGMPPRFPIPTAASEPVPARVPDRIAAAIATPILTERLETSR